MKVRYKFSVRMVVWCLFLLYGVLLYAAEFDQPSILSGWAIFTAASWSFLMERFFSVDPDGLINNLSRYSYDLRGGGFVLLEGKKSTLLKERNERMK